MNFVTETCSPRLRGENSPCAPWLIPVPPLRGDGLATVQSEQHDEVDHRQREAHDPPRECRLETCGWNARVVRREGMDAGFDRSQHHRKHARRSGGPVSYTHLT